MKPGVPDNQRPPRTIQAATAALFLILFSTQTLGSTISDLMIVVDADGHHYTAQHTLFTQEELTVITLPRDRTQLYVEFGGQNSAVFARAHERNPHRLSLWSGAVFSRFRHQFTHTPQELNDASGLRRASLNALELTMAKTSQLSYSVTWVLPAGAVLVKLTPADTNGNLSSGLWTSKGNLITYRQLGGMPAELEVEFMLKNTEYESADNCTEKLLASDECLPDIDADGIPDNRDVCLPSALPASQSELESLSVLPDSGDDNLRGTDAVARPDSRQASGTIAFDVLGCSNEEVIVLEEIEFESDKTYLSAKVRSVLDRVARAIQASEGKLFEIAAHTDHTGRAEYNKDLSDNRAIAIRHYLMLRGVGPNQIRARGYGETLAVQESQAASNKNSDRRVELRRLD
jgi:outer membrane protein OmpA-like peptidoglycan-associated protein